MGFGYFQHPWYFHRRPVTLIPFKASIDAIRVGNFHRVVVDAVQNFVAFLPLGGFGSMFFGRRRRWRILAALATLSCSIEIFQYFAVVDRRASVDDFIFNCLGASIGIGVGLWMLTELSMHIPKALALDEA